MKMNTIIKQAMLDNDINGKMELVERSSVSYSDITKLMNGDGSVKLSKAVDLLGFLGYELKINLKDK